MGIATPPEGRATEARAVADVRGRLADLVGVFPSEAELALVLRLLRSFAAKTPSAGGELVRLVHEGADAPVQELAHSLKGSAANIGATGLAELCARIEDRARGGGVDDPGRTEQRLTTEINGALHAVRVLTAEYEAIGPGIDGHPADQGGRAPRRTTH